MVLGGDHSIVLGELRAHAAAHRPVGVVLLDAHADTWDQYYGEKILPRHPVPARPRGGPDRPAPLFAGGTRGSLYAASDLDEPRSWGFEIITCAELRTWTPEHYGERVRARIGDGPTYLSFDSRARPGVRAGHGHDRAAGLRRTRPSPSCARSPAPSFVGYDIVEVSPQSTVPARSPRSTPPPRPPAARAHRGCARLSSGRAISG